MKNKLFIQIIFVCLSLNFMSCSGKKTKEDLLEDFKNEVLKEKNVSKDFLRSFGVETREEFEALKIEKPIPLVILNGGSIPSSDSLNKIMQDSTNLTYMVGYTKDSVIKCKTIIKNVNGKISVILIERNCGDAIHPVDSVGKKEYATLYMPNGTREVRVKGTDALFIITDINQTEIVIFKEKDNFIGIPLKKSGDLSVGRIYDLSKIGEIFEGNYMKNLLENKGYKFDDKIPYEEIKAIYEQKERQILRKK